MRLLSTSRAWYARSPLSSLVVLLGLLSLANTGWAQKEAHKFEGPGQCLRCHDAPTALDSLDFVLLNESKIWLEKDNHAKAHELLGSPLGQSMAKRLKITDVLNDKRCLSCHANWHKDAPEPPKYFDQGVTCESCHGPSSNWLKPHAETTWRGKTPAEKKELGMEDVREPLGRARQCFSCHIGKADEGKVVTHDMYAAGHPPLPSIEIESFAEQMPPHWRQLRERPSFDLREKFLSANYPGAAHDPLADLPRTKGVVIGGVLALQASVRLFASQVAVTKDSPELAVFDCSACHHDLRSPSWRQQRGYHGLPPGRPTITDWPTALVKLGLRHEAGADDAKYAKQLALLEGRLTALRAAVAARPFGDAAKVRIAADELDASLETLAVALSKTPFDEASGRRALLALCELRSNEFPDFHSARQIAWAIKAIYTEVNTAYPTFAARPEGAETKPNRKAREKKAIDDLAMWRDGPRLQTQKKLDQLFDKLELNKKLALALPAGQEYKIDESLPGALKQMSDYDAAWFRKQLAELKKSF